MRRQKFSASIWKVTDELARAEAFAHNSGVRKSEGLVREYARRHGVIMHGGKARRDHENGYTRIWRSEDGAHEVVAVVIPV